MRVWQSQKIDGKQFGGGYGRAEEMGKVREEEKEEKEENRKKLNAGIDETLYLALVSLNTRI